MSRLIVDAVQDETQAQAGTMADALILVSVTDNEGNPVEGLKLENFTLRQGLHPDGGFPAIELTHVVHERHHEVQARIVVRAHDAAEIEFDRNFGLPHGEGGHRHEQ